MTARRLLRLALAVVATGWCAGELDAMAVLLGAATAPPPAPPLGGGAEVTTLDWNGVDPVTDKRYAEGYAEVLEFRGFSTGALCAKVDRKAPINGHTWCPDNATYPIWGGKGGKFPDPQTAQCWIDSIHAFHDGKVDNAPGTQVWVSSSCGSPPDPTSLEWNKNYDWRFSGKRPQDTEHGKLWPQIAAYIEGKVQKANGKKVVVYAHSGGTITAYAFLMSQTEAWRKQNILAYMPVVPVFGGTIASVQAIVSGWNQYGLDKCIGRQAALLIPSLLWMWPRLGHPADKFLWNDTQAIVNASGDLYTAKTLEKMLDDMGLTETAALLRVEKADLLDTFKAPLVDTYALYGYGVPTLTGLEIDSKLTPENFGTGGLGGEPCPTAKSKELKDPDDAGDGIGPLRSTARASQWSDVHKAAGVVNWNMGYQGMKHCEFCTPQSKADHECLLALFGGKALPSGCNLFKR